MSCKHQITIKYLQMQSNTGQDSPVQSQDSPTQQLERQNSFTETFENCQECGAFITQEGVKAIKEANYCFFSDISPYEMLQCSFQDEQKYSVVNIADNLEYLNERNILVSQIFEIGKRFGQREESVLFAVELLDKLFLNKALQISEPNERNLLLFQFTCLLLASKHEELDENIPLIKDLGRYFTRISPSNRQIPTYDEIVECERKILIHFNWDLMMLIPAHFVRLFLANGIIYDNESIFSSSSPTSSTNKIKKTQDKVHQLLEILSKNNQEFIDNKPSFLASLVIYCARRLNNFEPIWTKELDLLTTYDENSFAHLSDKLITLAEEKDIKEKAKNKENYVQKEGGAGACARSGSQNQQNQQQTNSNNSRLQPTSTASVLQSKDNLIGFGDKNRQSPSFQCQPYTISTTSNNVLRQKQSPFKPVTNITTAGSSLPHQYESNNTHHHSHLQTQYQGSENMNNHHKQQSHYNNHATTYEYIPQQQRQNIPPSSSQQTVPTSSISSYPYLKTTTNYQLHARQGPCNYSYAEKELQNHSQYPSTISQPQNFINEQSTLYSNSNLGTNVTSTQNNTIRDDQKFIPLRQKTQNQTVKKLMPIVSQTSQGDKTVQIEDKAYQQKNLNRNYTHQGSSLTRGGDQQRINEGDLSKLQSSLYQNQNCNPQSRFSRVPALGRDSMDYSGSGSGGVSNNNNAGGVHTTRIPQYLKSNQSKSKVDTTIIGIRDNSSGRLPHIEAGYRNFARNDTNEMLNKRSKSWKRSDDEFLSSTHLRMPLRKDVSNNHHYKGQGEKPQSKVNCSNQQFTQQSSNGSGGGYSSSRSGTSGTNNTFHQQQQQDHHQSNIPSSVTTNNGASSSGHHYTYSRENYPVTSSQQAHHSNLMSQNTYYNRRCYQNGSSGQESYNNLSLQLQ